MSAEFLQALYVVGGSVLGAFVGVRVSVASLRERVTALESEVKLLREAKHEHAQFLTKHEAQLDHMKHGDR